MFSLIVITHNSEQFIDKCLASIFTQDYRNFEVIVVDNGSTDSTVALVQQKYPHVCTIKNKDNRGPCGSRNQGIKASTGRWVLTLDCDVALQDNFLSKIKEMLDAADQDVGMVQPKILLPDGQGIYSCGIYLCWSRRFYDIGHKRKNNGAFNASRPIFGPCAAAAIYRRDMLEQIKEPTGYFDERFFFFVEDVDLAWRAQRRGWKCMFAPEAICDHQGNSSGYSFQLRQYLCFRNRYYTIRKNEGFMNYSKKVLPLLLYDLPRTLYVSATNRYARNGHAKHL